MCGGVSIYKSGSIYDPHRDVGYAAELGSKNAIAVAMLQNDGRNVSTWIVSDFVGGGGNSLVKGQVIDVYNRISALPTSKVALTVCNWYANQDVQFCGLQTYVDYYNSDYHIAQPQY